MMAMQHLVNLLEQMILLLNKVKEHDLAYPATRLRNMSYRENNTFIVSLDELGQKVFRQFFHIGCVANELKLRSFKNLNNRQINELVQNIVQMILENDRWLADYLGDYPLTRINIDDYQLISNGVFEVRSGLQFMIDLFLGLDDKLDLILNDHNIGLTPDFDRPIQLIKNEFNIKYQIKKNEWTDKIPKHHTWWP